MKIVLAVALCLVASTATAGELVVHLFSTHSKKTYDTGKFKERVLVDQGWDWDWYSQTGELAYRVINEPVYRRYNNTNLGLGYVWKSDNPWKNNWLLGGYHNSHHKPTVYFGRQFTWEAPLSVAGRQVEYGGFVAVATGYRLSTGRELSLIGGLIISVPVSQRVSIKLAGAPSISPETDSVIHLSLGYKF